MNLREINQDLISGGWNEKNSKFELTKIKFLNTVSIISLAILLAYSVLNFIDGTYWELIIKAVQIICLVITLIVIRKNKNLNLAANLVSIVFLTVSLATFFTGEPGTGAFWVFLYPPLILYAQGYKKGRYWMYAIYTVFIIIGILAYFGIIYSPYTGFNLFYFLLILFVISMLMSFFQISHERNQELIKKQAAELVKKNQRLKKESKERKENLEEIKEKKEQAEKMNQLMIGRENKIMELKKEISDLKKSVK